MHVADQVIRSQSHHLQRLFAMLQRQRRLPHCRPQLPLMSTMATSEGLRAPTAFQHLSLNLLHQGSLGHPAQVLELPNTSSNQV